MFDAVDAQQVSAVFCESTVSDAATQQVVGATNASCGGFLCVDSLAEPDGPMAPRSDPPRRGSDRRGIDGTDGVSAVTSVRDVFIRNGEVQALDGASLEVDPGTLTAPVGMNSSGKCTLFKTAMRMVRPNAGTVTSGAGGQPRGEGSCPGD